MKRGYLFIFMLLLVPFVSASIYTDSMLRTQYNLGDYIKLAGSLVEAQDVNGLLTISLACGNDTQQLVAKSLNLKAQQTETFNYNLPITGNLYGSCRFLIVLKDFNNNVIEQYETFSFDINKELISTVDSNSKEFQLGDKLVINGNVKNLNNENIEGLAVLYIKKDGLNYVVDSVGVIGGMFKYETRLTSIPAGVYSVDLDVSDVSGNHKLFQNVLSFDLYDELIIAGKLTKDNYLPGDVLELTGSAHKKTGPNVDDTKIEIIFENQTYTSDVKNGQYTFNSVLSKTIKSYFHNVTLKVSDNEGNSGIQVITFEITPIPTKLGVELDKEGYIPEDNINIKPLLYDQANDLMAMPLIARITDVDKKIVYEENKLTTDELVYKLPQFAVPGDWGLYLESENLKLNKKIVVESIELLNVNLVGQTLDVKNMGNELFDSKVDIDSDGIIKSELVRLKPSEETSIDLYKLFDDGTHTITVLGKSFTVSIVDPRNIVEKGLDGLGSVTGYYTVEKYGKPVGAAYLILLGLITIVIVGLVTKVVFKFNLSRKPDHVRRKYDNKLIEIRNPDAPIAPSLIKPEKKYNFQYGKADANDIQDFKKRMSEKYNRDRFNLPKKDNGNGGSFSMFN